MHEHVEIDLGPQHLGALQTIVDPVLVGEIPTVVWSPHGHDEAVRALLPLIDVMLLDSDDVPDPADAFARAGALCSDVYVVDLAWLRTTPWRERLAASFDLPERLETLARMSRTRGPPPRELDRERACCWPAGSPPGCTGSGSRLRFEAGRMEGEAQRADGGVLVGLCRPSRSLPASAG